MSLHDLSFTPIDAFGVCSFVNIIFIIKRFGVEFVEVVIDEVVVDHMFLKRKLMIFARDCDRLYFLQWWEELS